MIPGCILALTGNFLFTSLKKIHEFCVIFSTYLNTFLAYYIWPSTAADMVLGPVLRCNSFKNGSKSYLELKNSKIMISGCWKQTFFFGFWVLGKKPRQIPRIKPRKKPRKKSPQNARLIDIKIMDWIDYNIKPSGGARRRRKFFQFLGTKHR